MSAHIVRLGRRGVIDVATDIAVIVLRFNFRDGDEPVVTRHIGALTVGSDDFRNIFGAQKVLCFALAIFAVGIDEEDSAPRGSVFFVQDEDAGRRKYLRASFLATPEEDAMGHDGGHFAVGFDDGEHVLDEHEIGLLAFFWDSDDEAGYLVSLRI
jgi:hypothetical protein